MPASVPYNTPIYSQTAAGAEHDTSGKENSKGPQLTTLSTSLPQILLNDGCQIASSFMAELLKHRRGGAPPGETEIYAIHQIGKQEKVFTITNTHRITR